MDRLGAPERVCSAQTRFQFLDNGGSIMARSIGIRPLDDLLECLDRGPQIADTGMYGTRFTPERDHVRGEHQHPLDSVYLPDTMDL